MQIPYTIEERPDTGLNNSKLGIWVFLASEIMLFGGLFSAYVFLRMAAPVGDFAYWGSKLSIPMATFNTLVLISSSVTVIMSWASLKMKDFEKYKMYMGLTLLCALIFLVIKYFEYTGKFHHGIYPSSSTFMGIYFTLTGLHGLHIIGGMIVMGYFLLGIRCGNPILNNLRIELKLRDFTGTLWIWSGFSFSQFFTYFRGQ